MPASLSMCQASAWLLLVTGMPSDCSSSGITVIALSEVQEMNTASNPLSLKRSSAASRIEAGVFVVRPSQEDLIPILQEAASLFEPQASSRSIELEVDDTGPVHARVDRDRIIQALSNLLDNAVRLTPERGRVVASAHVDGSWVRISVQDTGPGVAPEIAERIFDRFSQGRERDGGSAGLGLAIVKGVAMAHDGFAELESTRGQGSTFTLRLPVAGPAAGEEPAVEVLG